MAAQFSIPPLQPKLPGQLGRSFSFLTRLLIVSPMPLSGSDLHNLDEAQGWLESGHWVECFDALERIDHLHRSDAEVMALRWNLYNKARQHVIAAELALGIQQRFPDEPAGYIWRS